MIKQPFINDLTWLGEMVEIDENDISGGSTLDNTMEDSAREISFIFKNNVIEKDISMDIPVYIEFDDLGEKIMKEYTFHIYGEANSDADVRFAEEANCYVL
ncbi:MAG: hypothetical protein LUD15_15245 [Bacteroides sp.]|nr:hypothetical protein [Bacteroides sp.]